MRRLLAVAALAAALPIAAQQALPPPQLEPVPEPPPAVTLDVQQAAEAGITLRPGDTAERFEVDGQQYIRVKTAAGTEYHLVEALPGDYPFARVQQGDSGVRAPMWKVLEW